MSTRSNTPIPPSQLARGSPKPSPARVGHRARLYSATLAPDDRPEDERSGRRLDRRQGGGDLLRERIAAHFKRRRPARRGIGLRRDVRFSLGDGPRSTEPSPFVFGIPAWCVTIAIMRGDAIVAGVILRADHRRALLRRRGAGTTAERPTRPGRRGRNAPDRHPRLGANHRVPARSSRASSSSFSTRAACSCATGPAR